MNASIAEYYEFKNMSYLKTFYFSEFLIEVLNSTLKWTLEYLLGKMQIIRCNKILNSKFYISQIGVFHKISSTNNPNGRIRIAI